MNRRQKIIISITGIFLVLFIMMGLTYAYYLTQITPNTNPNSISVNLANLELEYKDGTSNLLTTDVFRPNNEHELGTKTFSVINNGDETNYAVIINNIKVTDGTTGAITSFKSNDFRYTLTCTSEKGECDSVGVEINDVTELPVLPLNDRILVSNNIEKDDTHTYTLTVWYIDTGKDQSDDMNKLLEAKIDIEDPNRLNPYVNAPDSLAYNILNNAMNVNKENEESGFAVYRNVPLTKPLIEFDADLLNNKSYEENDFCKDCYYVVSDECHIFTDGTFKFKNPNVIKYSSGFYSIKGKYITNLTGYQTEEEANSQIQQTSMYGWNSVSSSNTCYEVGNKTTESTIYYKDKNSFSVESTLSVANDDYTSETGIKSYYFRGNVVNNYLEFGEKCFRIVRIEGDGSIKLILENDGLCSNNESPFIGTGDYGYSSSMIADFENTLNSSASMKHKLDIWFTGLQTFIDINKIKSTKVCIGDITTKYDSSGNIINESPSGIYYYKSYKRLQIDETPSLICDENGKSTNSHKVYTLTMDEVALSNVFVSNTPYDMPHPNIEFVGYLLHNTNGVPWWTLTPANYGITWSTAYIATLGMPYEGVVSNTINIRPAISLIPGIKLSNTSGNGTKTSPYRVVER